MTRGKRENNSKILGAISQNNTNFLSRSQELNLKPAAEKFRNKLSIYIIKNPQKCSGTGSIRLATFLHCIVTVFPLSIFCSLDASQRGRIKLHLLEEVVSEFNTWNYFLRHTCPFSPTYLSIQ